MRSLERRFDEPVTQAEDRLRVNLAHSRFGDVEHGADLGECETFEVVERHHEPVPLGQPVDRIREQIPRLFALERSTRVECLGIGDDIDDGSGVAFVGVQELVERNKAKRRKLAELIPKRIEWHVHVVGKFLLGGAPLERVFELRH